MRTVNLTNFDSRVDTRDCIDRSFGNESIVSRTDVTKGASKFCQARFYINIHHAANAFDDGCRRGKSNRVSQFDRDFLIGAHEKVTRHKQGHWKPTDQGPWQKLYNARD